MKRVLFLSLVASILLFMDFSCTDDETLLLKHYETKHVIILVIDGPRYSETWGDSAHTYIPNRSALLAQTGVLVASFYNNGQTYTNPGHTALVTGNYDPIANDGSELPHNPSLLQEWIKQKDASGNSCFLTASKDKLHVIRNTSLPGYNNLYLAPFDCGLNGNGTGGYRSDSITMAHLLARLNSHAPALTVVNLKDPDTYGHLADSLGYLQAILRSDQYVQDVWDFIQNDPRFKDKTTLIVTNDHGRHSPGIANGYIGHGDGCAGCRRIEFFAISPDFKKNTIVTTTYEQIDVSATVAELLHLSFPRGKGKVMRELFLHP